MGDFARKGLAIKSKQGILQSQTHLTNKPGHVMPEKIDLPMPTSWKRKNTKEEKRNETSPSKSENIFLHFFGAETVIS